MQSKRIRIAAILSAALVCACAVSPMSEPVQAQPSGAARGDGPAARMFEKMVLTDVNRNRLSDVRVEDWLGTEEARFAHALKIPNPVPADSGYRPGMTQQQYFEHLCKTEAGEFIFKTADNVEGIFQMRPRRFMYETTEMRHLYAMEDPYGYWAGENDNPGREFVGPLLYSFLENLPAVYRKEYAWSPDLYDPSLAVPPPPEAKSPDFLVTTINVAARTNWNTTPNPRRVTASRGAVSNVPMIVRWVLPAGN